MQDREEVLSKSKLLKTATIYVSEDLSRKTREHRNELFKYMRFVKRRAPNRKCVIRYDKLFVDNDCFVFDEAEGRVVRSVPKAESPIARTDSRQVLRPESSLGKAFSPQPGQGLTRAESVHSVSQKLIDILQLLTAGQWSSRPIHCRHYRHIWIQ